MTTQISRPGTYPLTDVTPDLSEQPAPVRKGRRTAPSTDVNIVDAVASEVAAAAGLAGIEGQSALLDPRTNPRVRPVADELDVKAMTKGLTYKHRRDMRGLEVDDAQAAAAVEALRIIENARARTSPASSVIALHKGRKIYMSIALTASLLLSAGSASGIAAYAVQQGAHDYVGYIAEVGLSGLSTLSIMYRSHISTHAPVDDNRSWRKPDLNDAVLGLTTVGPLAAGAGINYLSDHGIVGVICAAGAAAFAIVAHIIAHKSSKAIAKRAEQVSLAEESRLRQIAKGQSHTAEVAPVEIADEADVIDQLREQVVARRLNVAPAPRIDAPVEDTPPAEDTPSVPVKVARNTGARFEDHPEWDRIFKETLEIARRGKMPSLNDIAKAFNQKNKNRPMALQRAVYAELESRTGGGE